MPTLQTGYPNSRLLIHLARPARGGAAAVVVVFAFLLFIAIKARFIGIPLALLVISWFFKYAYVLFDHTVRGFDEPPTLDIHMMNPVDEQRPLAQVARRPKPVAYRSHPDIEQAVGEPVSVPRIELTRLSVDLVTEKRDSLLWNAYIERHHYLRYQLMPGAQLRYFVRAADQVVTLMSFGASAWKTKPRDALIGWNPVQRQRNLHLIVNNARFLILPWIRCHNLASRVLALISRRLADDWQARYAYRPVLLETFVEKPRFTGTCYKAANWQHLGDTQGRGKLDTLHRRNKPIKSVWVYPLVPDFRRHLCTA